MTTGIATVGVSFAGVDLQPADLKWFLEVTRGLLEVPSVRGRDSIVPNAAGRFEHNRKNDVLQIILAGWITADPTLTDLQARRESFRGNADTIRTLFAPDRGRENLVLTLESGATQSITARPLNIVGGRFIASEYQGLTVELEGYGDWDLGTRFVPSKASLTLMTFPPLVISTYVVPSPASLTLTTFPPNVT